MTSRKFITLIALLLVTGLIFISVSSITEATNTIGDKFFFIKKQLVWSLVGAISFGLASIIHLNSVKKYSSYFFYFTCLLLAVTLVPRLGNSALGARRWLDLGLIGVQPSEIFKLAAIIFFASLFSQEKYRHVKYLLYHLIVPLGLIILEPNMSTAILVAAICITIFYLANGNLTSILVICLLAIITSSALIISSPYRKARFDQKSYHSSQMTLTLTSGHIFGKGFANSDQKYRYLPKISTDSILAVIGEETGFIGVSLVILLYGLLINAIFLLGRHQIRLSFPHLLSLGIGCWLAYQSLINMAAVVSLIPLTGITLPLISYGGSSLVTTLFGLGLINNLLYSTNHENQQGNRHHRDSPHTRHRTHSPAKTRPKK